MASCGVSFARRGVRPARRRPRTPRMRARMKERGARLSFSRGRAKGTRGRALRPAARGRGVRASAPRVDARPNGTRVSAPGRSRAWPVRSRTRKRDTRTGPPGHAGVSPSVAHEEEGPTHVSPFRRARGRGTGAPALRAPRACPFPSPPTEGDTRIGPEDPRACPAPSLGTAGDTRTSPAPSPATGRDTRTSPAPSPATGRDTGAGTLRGCAPPRLYARRSPQENTEGAELAHSHGGAPRQAAERDRR
jgi:hypothetical protein